MRSSRFFLFGILLPLIGCGGQDPPRDAASDGGHAGDAGAGGSDARPADAAARKCDITGRPKVVCAGDPAPCPGSCNAKGYCEIDCGFGPEVRLPPSRFVLGGDPVDGTPAVPFTFASTAAPLLFDKFETPVSAYRKCVDAGACTAPGGDSPCSYYIPLDDPVWVMYSLSGDHPVNCVDLAQAVAYCAWKGARLPTRSEWVLAARGAADTGPGTCSAEMDLQTPGRCNVRLYPWGDDEDPWRANVRVEDDGLRPETWRGRTTTPVGFFDGQMRGPNPTKDGSSPFGIHDLTGNLLEWAPDNWIVSSAYGAASFTFHSLSWSRPGPSGARGNVGIGFRCVRDSP